MNSYETSGSSPTPTMVQYTKTANIYALLDPRDFQVRYVGSTTISVLERLNAHLRHTSGVMLSWLEELASEHLYPIPALLEVVPVDRQYQEESKWIHHTLGVGSGLLNISDPVTKKWLKSEGASIQRDVVCRDVVFEAKQ